MFDSVEGIEFDCIIVENGSIDGSGEIFRTVIGDDARFRLVALGRNYGTDGGISVGLWCASGDACVIMNADLQDPPELIPEFISKWLLGWNNVYGLITNREGVSRSRRALTGIFYNLIGWASEYPMPKNASDFRIVDRSVYRVAREMPERRRFMRGIFAFIEPRSLGIPHVRPARFAGASKISISVVGFAYGAILASSKKPLRILCLSGFLLALLAIGVLITLSVRFLTLGVPFNGYGTLVAVNLLGFGFIAVFLGVIGEYISMIFDDVRARPLFIIENLNSEHIDQIQNLKEMGPGFSES